MTSNHSNWYLETYSFLNKFLSPYLPHTTNHYSALPDLPVVQLNVQYIEYAGDAFLLFPFYLVLGGLLASFIHIFLLNSESNIFLTSLFSFSEKEVNALDDLLIGVLLMFLFFFYNFLGFYTFLVSCSNSLGFFVFFAGVCFMLLSIPTAMVYNFGFYFIISIRGSATTLSYIYELILDYVNLVSFALRLIIQLVRIIVIGVTYYMYNHLFFVYDYFTLPATSVVKQTSFTLVGLLIWWARLVFEGGHTFVIFGIQLIAFSVMILWLFQFLFTLFFADTMEHSFLKRTTN